jgi:uncharacterized protein
LSGPLRNVTVIKKNLAGKETWRYPGSIIGRTGAAVLVEAFFNHDDQDVQGLLMARGDRFIEFYSTRAWFNIFEVHDHANGSLKGWYCNVCRPAEIVEGVISYVDLSLDLVVFPDGRRVVLDEDDYEELGLSPVERKRSLSAMKELKHIFSRPIRFELEKDYQELVEVGIDHRGGE